MRASELVAEVQRITDNDDNDDYDGDDILALLNRGVLEIAGGGDRQYGLPMLAPLPDLFTSDTVTLLANDSSVAMPAEYHRGLKRVTCAGEKLKKYDSHIKFLDTYEGTTGTPEAYCLVGSTLWVLPSPSSATDLDVYFHRLPVDMQIVAYDAGPPEVEAVDDTPDGLPVHLHHRLLVNFACKEIFSEVESGIDMPHPDTDKHTRLHQMALTDLERFIGTEDGEACNIADEEYTEDMVT